MKKFKFLSDAIDSVYTGEWGTLRCEGYSQFPSQDYGTTRTYTIGTLELGIYKDSDGFYIVTWWRDSMAELVELTAQMQAGCVHVAEAIEKVQSMFDCSIEQAYKHLGFNSLIETYEFAGKF